MSQIVVKGKVRPYTNKNTGEVMKFAKYTIIEEDGEVARIDQDVEPVGLPSDSKMFSCEAILGLKQFNTKEGLKDRPYIKELRNVKPLKL